MYCLSNQQIEFILNDIRARGVKMESLQLDLLDHVCCLIEQNLEPDGNFEDFYNATIKTFYKDELREIEVETINLLTFKNYYAMKKIMMASGAISAVLLSIGIFFKFQYWAGASALMVVGIVSFSLLFLPLVFVLKIKEQQATRDKLITALGTTAAILLSLGILFKIMHWPGANVMGLGSLIVMGLVFLPVYFFTGIRHPETKVNTIVSSIMIVASCGLFLALVRSPAGNRMQQIADTHCYVKTEQLYSTELQQTAGALQSSQVDAGVTAQSNKILNLCQELKTYLVQNQTGLSELNTDFEAKDALLSDALVENLFPEGTGPGTKLSALKQAIAQYNQTVVSAKADLHPVAVKATILETENKRVLAALTDFISIQIAVLQNQRQLATAP